MNTKQSKKSKQLKIFDKCQENADDVENLKTFKNSSLKKHNLLKMYSTSGYPRRRWVYLI